MRSTLPLSSNTTTSEEQHPDSLIEQIIEEAKKTFTPGHKKIFTPEFKTKFSQEIYKNYISQCKNSVASPNHQPHKDPHFKRNAHWISGTSFIAAEGPSTEKDLAQFIEDTVYNPYRPINNVIALGSRLAYKSSTPRDFYDYCLQERDLTVGNYSISIKRKSGQVQTARAKDQIFPIDPIHSQLSIKPIHQPDNTVNKTSHLHVSVINLKDGCSLDLNDPKRKNLKKMLWHLFLKSQEKPILIHCKAGEGRTGHLLLMFEILKNYNVIFGQNTVQASAKQIHRILQHMRKQRVGLIHNVTQFERSISNADILYRYSLEKNFTMAVQQVNEKVSAMSLFAKQPKPTEEVVTEATETAQNRLH